MKTNSKIKSQNKVVVGNDNHDESYAPSSEAKGKSVSAPDYSSMKSAIEKIKDPVSFKALKTFYNLV